jgi:hypothetical protein
MNIEKNMTVGQGAYQYKAISDTDVTLAVKRAEKLHGLVSIPIKQELINSEVIKTIDKDNKEKLTFVDTIKMTLKIINVDVPTEVEFVESFGKGVDSSDKGLGKASTYARKYALLNAYKIASGEDPDANKSETTTVAKTPSERKTAVINLCDKNAVVCQSVLQHFNVGEIGDLSDSQFDLIYKTYKDKNKI